MKRENNKKFKKRKRNQNRSLTCRVLSMMFAIVLFCSTVLINTDYVSQASSFDDMVDMVEIEDDSAAVDTSEDTGDDLDTDVNFESESEEGSAETYSESDDFGSSDADFSSGENMFTDGTSESSAPAEEAAQPVSCIVNLKNETIEVKAEAPAGVLPNGTQMIVKAVENNTEDAELTDQYNKLAAKITEQLQSQGKNLDGFLAYNVSFTDADGNPVEPAGKVNYSFTYKEASSPELTDPAASTVTAAMIRTNKETSELELTELKAEEDQLTVETNESRQLTKAAFQSAATAAYTFVWSSTPAADDNENNENKEENSEVNNGEVNTDTNTENTEENGEETNTENNVENSEEEQNPEEAPDQEQTKMIRVIADEVNLRVTPSTEAEVIATVDTDTQLPLLETVTDEDEFTWYKVSYEEAQAYVRSDMAEVVETEEQGTENEDANEEAEVQVEDEVTYSKTIGNVVVTATAAKDVLPDNAEFVVTPIVQETDPDKYTETENKLNEKAEEDGYEIAGFLAYDIFFQDNDGNKIEPVDGSVNVSMHYTEPSVPEEVAQVTENGSEAAVFTEEDEFSQNETTATQMDITMMHLVEDENGNVNVVDMTQEGNASVETDAVGSVQKAEFETTSFSTFTITWKKRKEIKGRLEINVIDTNGNGIGSGKPINLEYKKEYLVNKVVEEIGDIEGYSFYKAKVSSSPKAEGTVVKRIIFKDGENQYNSSDSGGKWENIGNDTVYFVYAKNPTPIPTIDHTKAGITMKMTNLVNGNNFSIGTDRYNLINFGPDSGYGDGTIKKGLLKNLLGNNGYPITTNNKNIESLFSGKTVNKLFSSDYYNATGYYEYSSFKNYAYLGNASDFKVYDALGTPKNETGYFYKRGNFMPYNPIEKGKFSTNTNQYDENGKKLADTDLAKGKELYLSQGSIDYYFSMYMGANFIQPKDGNATHKGSKAPMIYEFNGDDDMWVYIDNVLVLDIGGVHDAHSGKIDFSTGVVSWTDCVTNGNPDTESTNLKAIFQNAGIFPDGTTWDNNKVAEYFNGNTFKDYTTHSFKMFYMERGAGASNLHMKFNIQVIPEGQVEVRKELSNTDKEKYSNVKFAFQVYAQDILSTDANGNETYKDEYVLLNTNAKNKDTGADIVFLDNQDINGESYNSVFYLKPDESAVFTGLKANRKYYVKEIGVKSEEYDEVKINNTSYTAFNENNEQTGEIKDISTDKKQVSQRPLVVYTNNCSAANSRELQITKKMKDNKVVVDTFSFKIQLSNSIGELVPYVNGDYYLKDADGNYYYNEEGNLTSNEKEAKICGKTTEQGIVNGVPVGYTVAVTQLLSGTNFKVDEVDLTSNYKTPAKKVDCYKAATVTDADGEIELGRDAKVTITNEINKLDEPEEPFIKVTKTFEGLTKEQVYGLASADSPYQITVTNGNDTRILKMAIKSAEFDENLTGKDTTWTYTWKLQGCSEGTYNVVESNYSKDGYQVAPTINGNSGYSANNVKKEKANITYTNWSITPNCNQREYTVGDINLIVAELTQNKGYFVWTRQPASVSSRMAIIEQIKTIWSNASIDNCSFFSGSDKINNTLIFRGGHIRYNGINTMCFDDPKQWTKFATGNYTIEGGHDAEVEFVNTYEESTADLDLVKVSKNDTNSTLKGAEFQLYKKENGNYTSTGTSITVKNGDTDIELQGLKPGEYYLEETKAPVGYMLLGKKIYFKQVDGNISLTDEQGNALVEGTEFWSLSTNEKNVLTIQNQILYTLPSTGGNGIYWYMIGGMVLMSTAAWILYKNKCREVLGK
mgnify:CR=1 FL=1